MRALSISGGSTKIAALAGAANTVCNKHQYNPDVITGISAGALLSVPLAMGMYSKIEELTTSFTLCDIFNIPPVNSKGDISFVGKFRAVVGKQSLGTQDALRKTLSKLVTQENFDEYKHGPYAQCYIGAVEYKTGARKYYNIKECSYNEYLDVAMASSSIPVFVESVEIDRGFWFDGGVRDHIGSAWLLEHEKAITKNVSIYSRPKDFDITDKQWEPKNIVEVLTRTLEIMNMEISKNDQRNEDSLAVDNNIDNTQIFMPHVLSTNLGYEVSPELLKRWYRLGVKTANSALDK